MRVAEALVNALINEEVEYYFTVFAEHILSFTINSIRAYESRGMPKPINAAYEPGAGFMSIAYSRVSGRVGVCIFTGGPGVLSAVNPIAMSYVESDPIVIIGTTPPRNIMYRNALHAFPNESDQINIFKSITKRCFRVISPSELLDVTAKAFNIALSNRPGPVYVEIPSDMFNEELGEFNYIKMPITKPAPSDELTIEVIRKILNSKRPVILAGRGVTISKAESELQAFAEFFDIPICTTVMGKGVISPTHPLYGGIAAGDLGDRVASELLINSDLVLAIGVRFSQMGTGRYTMKINGELIHVNVSEDEFGRVFKPSMAIVADAKEFLNKMLKIARREGISGINRDSAKLLGKLWAEAREETPKVEGGMIEAWEVVWLLRKIFDEDTIFVGDVGAHRIETFTMPIYKPRTYIVTTSYASMGMGVPGAIAAKLAKRDSNVVGLVGDGGFLMTGLELVTAVRYELPVIIIVFNDSSYRVLRIYEKVSYGTELTHKLPKVNFSELAKSMGARGIRIEGRDELKSGIEEALSLARNKPVVVDVMVNPESIPLPMTKLYKARYIYELNRKI